jgi:hypothetical protein
MTAAVGRTRPVIRARRGTGVRTTAHLANGCTTSWNATSSSLTMELLVREGTTGGGSGPVIRSCDLRL